ncbi:RNA polymerase sigma-70 factor [Tumebacillus permanentifrigoris]|uniref:RNA polymerase sigma-70 factor (ECF subfamily) n=1 Tax=Tumebacillus permanentifrigoris TaxID=378543 RepID=A0A316DH64_9BACL|nr:RNA polymerase sigma-70 factor [Tumebacillus permanentifrigoris]PWK16579.1 RNA polymerase sigma-70 factor (ECF subfamily) [Tumebacillus permanentifrigoris]
MQDLYPQYRPLLFSLAYRMLGTAMDAEDMVQETFLAFAEVNDERKLGIANVRAYLCKMLTNRCVDFLRSAKHRREVYVGVWLPEPVVFRNVRSDHDPLHELLWRDDLSMAYLMMMETLSPTERAVFVLREAYQYDYAEISELVDKEEANCRKIYSRVKNKLGVELEACRVDYAQDQAMLNRFLAAFSTGDAGQLLKLLAPDATLYSDGGGNVQAAIRPIVSGPHVLAFLQGITRKSAANSSMEFVTINGQPGLLFRMNGQVDSTFCFHQKEGLIQSVYLVRNPEKLTAIQ